MGQPVELVPLVCLKCSTPVRAEVDEVAWVCSQCEQGLALDEEQGLLPLEVCYAAEIAPNAAGKPYWVVEGQVAVQRATYRGNRAEEARQFWAEPRRFFIPAYTCTLEDLLARATGLIKQPPQLTPGPQARFEPVTLHREDINAAAEFIVMALEAARSDQLKEVSFSLQLSQPVLWILPA